MNEMYKTIIEQYEKDGYESAKKSFMDLVNADRSDDEKDDVILSYITMAKLAFVNKDNEMAEKLLRLDNKFGNSSEKSHLTGKADELRDKPEQDNSVNVINILGIEFVELSPKVYVSRKTISYNYVDVTHTGSTRGSWGEAKAFCDILSGRDPYYNFRLPTIKELIKCHEKKEIQLEQPSVYEWTAGTSEYRNGHIINLIAINSVADVVVVSNSGRTDGMKYNTTFRVIAELKH